MISRTLVAVGAILLFQTIFLGSNIAVHANESGKLRRRLWAEGKQGGQGYRYTRNSNRFGYQRERGGVLGAQVLRPYEPDAGQPYRGPNRDNIFDRPHPPRTVTGGPPKVGKSKAAKVSKKGRFDYYDNYRPARTNPYPYYNYNVPPPPRDSGSQTRQGKFADAFTWTRVPGQPLFISQTETPIIVLDVPFQVGFDEDGDFFLVDQEGKEITVVFNDDGTFTVIEEVRPPVISFDDNGNWMILPRGQVARDPTPKPTEREISTVPPTTTGTMPPTTTAQPTVTPQPTEFCTDDVDWRFNDLEVNSCEFIGENPGARCPVPGAIENCRLTCNELCETITPAPTPPATTTQDTPAPSSAGTCTDNPDFLLSGIEGQDCDYVARNAANRCPRQGVTEACPSVCNEACAPTAGPTDVSTTVVSDATE